MGDSDFEGLTTVKTAQSSGFLYAGQDTGLAKNLQTFQIDIDNFFNITAFLKFDREAIAIVADAITPTKSFVKLEAQTGVTDDLATINSESLGRILILTADGGDTITIKDGTGNIDCGGDFAMVGTNGDTMVLLSLASTWICLAKQNN